ncbi:serine hydrolase domain-containing protein [Actinomadura rupiterrae]|uniref:serine hydrolase domain-containing protein n=1 Tax=Actinomadura rupiterrae TaxID=559627 RepID=UPI0020A2605B|nr:serine hydrolase domain-containing protein [Actinomadura rupiterrae]MCP2337545.1 CubicO group peptidase (beta-lactamase class C family) [Actinomadura rupiterrae]
MNEPGHILHIRHPDGTVTLDRHGLANLEHGIPITTDTAFNVGSVAKQITAHLTLLTPEIDIDTPAQHWLPNLQVPDVTVTDLIQHHGGIRDAESLLSLAGFRDLDHYTADDLLQLAYRQQRRAVPKGQFLYSNTGYLLLTKILEQTHTAPLNQIARALLFDPLNMPSTHFKDHPQQIVHAAATAYRFHHGSWRTTTVPVALPGPGSLWTSTTDLDRWLRRLDQTRQAPADQTLRAPTPVPSSCPHWHYGPGIFVSGGSFFHHGHEQGFSAAIHLTADGTAVIALSNRHDTDAGRLSNSAVSSALPLQSPSPERLTAPSNTRATDDYCHLVGEFASDDVPGVLRIINKPDGLALARRGATDALIPIPGGGLIGPGFRIQPALEGKGLRLDLERAPGLIYRRIA